MENGIPKSLHTVRIIAAIAADLIKRGEVNAEPHGATLAALRVCGYGDCTPDPYDIRGKAVAAVRAQMIRAAA